MFDSKAMTPRAVIEYPLGHPPERMALEAVRAPDPRVIAFARTKDGPVITVHRGDGGFAPLVQVYRLHSDGMEFGYGGSGPSDCALNILSLVVSPREAWRMHQDFKTMVARIPQDEGGTIALADVRAWIAARYETELADTAAIAEEKEMRELLADIEKEEREAAGAAE